MLGEGKQYTNPVIDSNHPDPGVLIENGMVYAVTTSGDAPDAFPIMVRFCAVCCLWQCFDFSIHLVWLCFVVEMRGGGAAISLSPPPPPFAFFLWVCVCLWFAVISNFMLLDWVHAQDLCGSCELEHLWIRVSSKRHRPAELGSAGFLGSRDSQDCPWIVQRLFCCQVWVVYVCDLGGFCILPPCLLPSLALKQCCCFRLP